MLDADRIYGIIFTAISIGCLIPTILLIRAIWRDSELIRNNAYKFIVVINFLNVVQLVLHAVTGIRIIFPELYSKASSKVIGSLIVPAYIAYVVMNLVLSINRFVLLFYPLMEQVLFSRRGMIGWYVFTSAFFVAFCGVYLSPLASMIYFPDTYGWNYDYEDHPLTIYVQRAEGSIEIVGMYLSCVIYVIVFVGIVSKRKKYGSKTNYRTDVKILIQASIITACNTFNDICWQFFDDIFGENPVVYGSINLMWVINCVANPIVFFLMSGSVQCYCCQNLMGLRDSSMRVSKAQQGTTIGATSQIPRLGRQTQSNLTVVQVS